MADNTTNANDYALALYLNKRVSAIFAMVADHKGDLPDLTQLNKSYVLMVSELEKLYGRHAELSSITENICWRKFDTIDAIEPYELFEYSDDYINHSTQHISQVNKLCLQMGQLEPLLPASLKKIVAEAKANVIAFSNDWLIPEYTFEISDDGSLLVNGLLGVMDVKKVQAGSATEMLLTQAKAKPNELFKPDLKGHSLGRGLRTSLKEVGFRGATEKLFMPVMDNQRGVMFRPTISRAQARKEHIPLGELDEQLKSLGAKTLLLMYAYPE